MKAVNLLRRSLTPAASISTTLFRQLSSSENLMPILRISDFDISDKYLSKTTCGSEEVNFASHDVLKAKGKDGSEYAVKAMNFARVGEAGEVKEYPPQEAKEQSVLEVLAMKVGGLFCPQQFPKGDVAADDKGNYFVVTKFIPNALSVRSLKERFGIPPEERDESVFSLKKVGDVPLRTTVNVPQEMYVENVKIPDDIKKMMQRDGYSVNDALLSGRIDLKLALYILGEKDEVLNRDGNTLLGVKGYDINQENKTITPEFRPIAIDCGLCFGRGKDGDIINRAFKLAVRENDSNQMGLELDGQPPTNLKAIKDNFLLRSVKVHESGKVDELLRSALPHLGNSAVELTEAMKERVTICYLAGKCVEAGLDYSDKENQAKEFLRGQLNLFQEKSASNAAVR